MSHAMSAAPQKPFGCSHQQIRETHRRGFQDCTVTLVGHYSLEIWVILRLTEGFRCLCSFAVTVLVAKGPASEYKSSEDLKISGSHAPEPQGQEPQPRTHSSVPKTGLQAEGTRKNGLVEKALLSPPARDTRLEPNCPCARTLQPLPSGPVGTPWKILDWDQGWGLTTYTSHSLHKSDVTH
ncbi:hypothetical protein MG293_018543 [Ovis ammon polii]|uniref:Uncharacterized protein n=1 Tax=Ovis ammon polii TaxID=230172 RepID=A0AAD4Y1V3_OVIAM|nr:hypothetical protein MG293_018543 [Ovis ammon polii]